MSAVSSAHSIEEVSRTPQRGPAPRTVLAIASLGAAVAFVDVTIVNIAFPDIEGSFKGTSISSLSWVLSAYNIVFAAFLVAAGRLADLLGRRRMFVFGLEIFTVASLLCALAPSTELLIAFRVVQAVGAAFLVPSSLALVLNAFPPDRRSHGVALLSAVAAGAAGLGPSLGGALVAVANWRLVFLVNLPIGAAAIVLARRRLVESRTPGRRRMPDVTGSVLFALATAALVLAVVKGRDWGWASVAVIGSFAAAVALAVLVVRRSRHHRSPVIDLSLLRIRTFSVTNAMTVVAAAGFYGYTLTNVLFLTGVWRYTVLQAGLSLTPGPFVAAAVAGPTSRLAQRIGHRPVLAAGGLIWGAAVLWFVERVGIAPDFLGVWLPGIVMLGIGAGTLLPNLSGAAVASAPGESYATATGLNSVARQVGAALGVALVVAILGTPSPLDVLHAFQHAWTFGAICLFVAGAGCLLVERVRPESSPSLADAARAVLRASAPPVVGAHTAPRARRAVSLDGGPALARPQSTAEFLGQVPLFGGLDAELRAELAAQAVSAHLPAGAWLFHEGDPGDAMYVIRAGRLEVVDEQTGSVIRELGRGDVLGELALLTASPRSAAVRALRASDLLVVRRSDFDALLDSSPALSKALNRVLAEQLRSTRASAPTARPRPATIAVLGLDTRVPVSEIAEGLAAALRGYTGCALLTGRETPEPAAGDAAAAYGPIIDAAEAAHDVVVLAAGSALEPGPWLQYSLQQADRILAVTGGGPIPGAVRARSELHGCDLVAYDISPGALVGWAAVLAPVESHVLATATLPEDLDRTARRLAGHSIGVVLSGGGARAFAHIGVLEELVDSGLAIDRVIGVSMGAYLAGLFALGLDGDAMTTRCFDEWVKRRPLGDYTVPRHALIRGERMRAMLQRTFGEALIEELPCSFTSACADLRSGELRLSRHGLLWEAVGLSMCLPIIAPPQVRGRELLIDGSLVDNLPVGAMADLGEGPIIAVDVKASFDRPTAQSPTTNGAERAERPPSLGETLTRVLLLGSANTSEAARRHADLVIKPRAEGVGLLEFHQLDAAREAGRAAAREALAAADLSLRS